MSDKTEWYPASIKPDENEPIWIETTRGKLVPYPTARVVSWNAVKQWCYATPPPLPEPKTTRVTVERRDGEKRTFELPEPMREELEMASEYWSIFSSMRIDKATWDGCSFDYELLKAGNCVATEADAEAWAECQRFMRGVSDD